MDQKEFKSRNLALFDFDNTISYHDHFTKFLFYQTSKFRVFLGAFLLSPIYLIFRLRLIRPTIMRRFAVFVAFCRVSEEELRKRGLQYSRMKLESDLRPEAIKRIQMHKAQGDKVVVVSASLRLYLEDWCLREGLDLICSELAFQNERATGLYQGNDCSGQEKSRRVSESYNLEEFASIYGYGDSDDDLPMLALADKVIYRWREKAI